MAIQLKTFIIIVFLVIGYPVGYLTGGETKFSTQQVRELWQVCSISFRNLNPGIGQDVYFPVCDCYMDHIRTNYTPEEVMDNMTKEEYSKLSQDLRTTCNPKLQKPQTFT
jgi:hypothetical protein